MADLSPARAEALRIVRALRDAGHVAYFAGGCVRDELLGLTPTDYDVATDAPPDRLRALFPRSASVGAAFGVILVQSPPRPGFPPISTEVATFRAEGPYSDRRRPDTVQFSDAASDARRRDFTINALFLDPFPPPDPAHDPRGVVIDLVGGMPDLRAGVLRAVGNPDHRLAEDHLRALRAVRLSARLGFTIDPATREAILRHAGELAGVSRERIGDELRMMLAHPTRARAAKLMQELALDAPALLDEPRRADLRALASLPPDAPAVVAMAAWAHDRSAGGPPAGAEDSSPQAARRWRVALCLSNQETDAFREVLDLVECLRPEGDWSRRGVAGKKRLAARPAFAAALAIVGARDPAHAETVRRMVGELTSELPGLTPPPLVTGDDLVAMGLSPGPAFKRLLDEAYDAQLENRIRTKSEGLELVRRLGIK